MFLCHLRHIHLTLLIENTTVKIFIQKFDYNNTVIFEKINGNTVIENLYGYQGIVPARYSQTLG